jgi:hypothetical protein
VYWLSFEFGGKISALGQSAMNTKRDSSFTNAISALKRVQKFGLHVRFTLSRGTVGLFSLDGRLEELSDKRLLLRGEQSIALVDWETCAPREVEDMSTSGSNFSFLLHFALEGDDFFSVAGLESLPTEQSDVVN